MENNCLVIKLRKNFIKIYEQNPELFDEEDVDRIQNNDFTIKRYLLHKLFDELSALQMLTNSMKWRKEFGVNYLNDSYFPKEFYLSAAIVPYFADRNGFKTLYIRIKMIKKIPEMKTYYKKYLVHNINKIDLETNGNGWVLIVDASGAGISNCDLDLLFFLISTLNANFPAAIQYILIHELPFVLAGVWKVAKAWIPGPRLDMIRFSSSRDITQYIASESLPDFMGGEAKLDYRKAPVDSPDALGFGIQTARLPVDTVHRIVDIYRRFLDIH